MIPGKGLSVIVEEALECLSNRFRDIMLENLKKNYLRIFGFLVVDLSCGPLHHAGSFL